MSRQPPRDPPDDDDVVVPFERSKKAGVDQVREIARAGLDKIRLTKARRGEDPAKGEPVHFRTPAGDVIKIKPGKWVANHLGLPSESECPVQVLGKDGDGLWVIDVDGELRRVEATPFGQATIQSLFGDRQLWLYWAFPRLKKAGTDENGDELWIVDTWRAEMVREAFWTAASRKGAWRPEDRIRGRGSWRDGDGRLVVHCGDALFVGGALRPVGEIDRTFYVAADPVPRPWSEPVSDAANPAPALLAAFRTFNWRRASIDPVLALGLIGAMLVSAALPWRPHGFVDGPSGSGKSTFLGLVADIIGPILVHATDATPAGVYQRMKYEARPVVLDEMEADAKGDRSREMIKLARSASSDDGQMLRGGADHKGVSFELRSCFLFAAIIRPVMDQQDINRFLLLSLRPLDAEKAKNAPVIEAIDTIGPRLLRRIADAWDAFPRLFEDYRTMLRESGHEPRGQQTYGVPLALAHMMLGEDGLEAAGLPWEDLRGWAALVGRAAVSEEGHEISTWRGAIRHLLGARIEVWRGGSTTTVGRLLEGLRAPTPDTMSVAETKRMLADVGLGLKPKGAPKKGDRPRHGWVDGCEGWWLAVPHEGDQLGRIYEGTPWGSTIRAKGGWGGAMRFAPEALGLVSSDGAINKIRINGEQMRCTMIDLEAWWAMLEKEEEEE